MKNVSKSAILPIVSTVLLGVGFLTNHHFNANLGDEVATIATVVINGAIAIWGVLHNHKKEVK